MIFFLLLLIYDIIIFLITIIFLLIITLIVRIYTLKFFFPYINYDQYFLNLSLKNKNNNHVILTFKTESKNYSDLYLYLKNKLIKYLQIKNNRLCHINYDNQVLEYNENIYIDDIVFEKTCQDFNIYDEFTKYQHYSIYMIVDKLKYRFYLIINHTCESGITIMNNLICNQQNCENMISLPKPPIYIPFMTELLIAWFIIRNIYYLYYADNNFNSQIISTLKLKYSINSNIDSNKLKYLKEKISHSYLNNQKISFVVLVLARAIITSYKCLKIKKNFYNVCLLVGYQNTKFSNNCFSFIILNIDTCQIPILSNNDSINQCQLDNFIIYLNNMILKRKQDSIISYNIINYYLSSSFLNKLSSKFKIENKPIIDMIFSCLPPLNLKEIKNKNFEYDLIDKTSITPLDCVAPLYCLCYTINNNSKINYCIYDSKCYLDDQIEYLNYIYYKNHY